MKAELVTRNPEEPTFVFFFGDIFLNEEDVSFALGCIRNMSFSSGIKRTFLRSVILFKETFFFSSRSGEFEVFLGKPKDTKNDCDDVLALITKDGTHGCLLTLNKDDQNYQEVKTAFENAKEKFSEEEGRKNREIVKRILFGKKFSFVDV